MKVILKIESILHDNIWGFSDLIAGREITPEVKAEILELIKEDIYSALYLETEMTVEIVDKQATPHAE